MSSECSALPAATNTAPRAGCSRAVNSRPQTSLKSNEKKHSVLCSITVSVFVGFTVSAAQKKQKNGPSKTGHGSYMQKRPNILPNKGSHHVYSRGGRCVENFLSSWRGAGEPKPMTKSTCTGPWIPVPLELSMKAMGSCLVHCFERLLTFPAPSGSLFWMTLALLSRDLNH